MNGDTFAHPQLVSVVLLWGNQVLCSQWRIQKFWKEPRRHLSQMHKTNYMPFTWEKAAFWKNSEPIEGRRSTTTTPSPRWIRHCLQLPVSAIRKSKPLVVVLGMSQPLNRLGLLSRVSQLGHNGNSAASVFYRHYNVLKQPLHVTRIHYGQLFAQQIML